jgi:PAS domain S-box-containing protein
MPKHSGSALRQGPSTTPAAAPPRDVTWEVLSEHLNDLVVMADASGAIFYVSPSCRTLGYSQLDMIGRGPADFVHPDDLEHFNANTAALFDGGPASPLPPCGREHRILRKDGSWAWMDGSPSLIQGPDGRPMGITNVFRDVSDRRVTRDALRESEARYRLLAEHASDMISQTSVRSGRLTFLSPSVERLTGYCVDDLIGKRMQDLVHPDDRDAFMSAFTDLVSGRRECGEAIRFRARRKDGDWLWLESNPRLIRDDKGAPVDIVDMTRDVGRQQALEVQLREAVARAEAAAEAKAEFLANMSHEIRTPLTAVLGFTSLLAERGDLDAVAHHQVERIAGAGRALLAIVNDVLDYSKLEAGQVSLNPRPTAAAAVVSEVVEMFEPQAEAKGLTIGFEAVGEAPAAVRLDGDRLRQILVNLIGNAVKFTERGSVWVSLSYDADRQQLAVEVADTGPGISAAGREKLFERFSQLDASSTRAKGGTGLGLAISRRLAAAMAGDIRLKSRAGRGSTFRLELPAAPAEPLVSADTIIQAAELLEGVRVLVVDDNPINRELARAILEPVGVDVSEAADGAEAVEAALALPVDLILMDLRMPGLHGREAAAAIRMRPGPNQDIPILAFSADADLTGGRGELGPFDGQVRKPVSPGELLSAVAEAMSDAYQPPELELTSVHG